MMNGKNEAGFTLIEIIIAMILVTLVGASVLMAFVNASRWAEPSVLAAVFDARGKLDQLNEEVRSDEWDPSDGGYLGNGLSAVTHTPPDRIINNRTYTQSYVVSSVLLGSVRDAYRKVVVTESWT